MTFPSKLRLTIDPIKFEQVSARNKHNDIHTYVTFVTGSLLAISESLPFVKSSEGNGLLHAAAAVLKEYKEDVK